MAMRIKIGIEAHRLPGSADLFQKARIEKCLDVLVDRGQRNRGNVPPDLFKRFFRRQMLNGTRQSAINHPPLVGQ